MVEVVNVVGSGLFNKEFDLNSISKELGTIAEYDPEKYPGMYLRFSQDSPLITVYRTGKYIITGAKAESELLELRDRLVSLFSEHGIANENDSKWFRVQNLVCTTDVGSQLNLGALSIGLGLEQTEYEPELFPGLIYRNPDFECVILIFSTGKVVITGSSDLAIVEDTVDKLHEKLSSFHLN